MFNPRGMASNLWNLGKWGSSQVPWRTVGKVGLGMAGVGAGIGMLGGLMNKIDAPPGVNRSMIRGGVGGAFGGPTGAVGGGLTGGMYGAGAGAAYYGYRGLRGGMLAAGAGRGAMFGAGIGAAFGFLKGSVRANQPVNRIKGLHY